MGGAGAGTPAFGVRAPSKGITPAYATSPCPWCPEPGCHQQGACQDQQRFARTDKPASSQTAVLGSPYESSAGSTKTRQGRGKGWYLALETQGQAVPYPSPRGKPDRPGGVDITWAVRDNLGPSSSSA